MILCKLYAVHVGCDSLCIKQSYTDEPFQFQVLTCTDLQPSDVLVLNFQEEVNMAKEACCTTAPPATDTSQGNEGTLGSL